MEIGQLISEERISNQDSRPVQNMTRRRFLLVGGALGLAGTGAVAIGCWKRGWFFGRRDWKHIVIHHSASDYGNAKTFEAWHRKRGMRFGMAYHFVIGNGHGLKDGSVETGSRWKEQLWGGHLGNWKSNLNSIGICLVGNFQNGTCTERQVQSLKKLTENLRAQYGIPVAAVRAHKEMPGEHTLCPGKHFPMKRFRKLIVS